MVQLSGSVLVIQIIQFMGAAQQKDLYSVTSHKYSFVHPTNHAPWQLSAWRWGEEELEGGRGGGAGIPWPFKFYSDEGYLLVLIRNHQVVQPLFGNLEQLRVSVGMLEWLYSFGVGEVQEYLYSPIQPHSQNKYVEDQLSLYIFIYAGENLSAQARLRLVSEAVGLERYIGRGGMCSVSKLYHQWLQYTDICGEVREKSEQGETTEYLTSLDTLAEDRFLVVSGQEEERKKAQIEEKKKIYSKLNSFKLIRKLLIEPQLPPNTCLSSLSDLCKPIRRLPIAFSQQLIVKQERKLAVVRPLPQQSPPAQPPLLNQSMPFQCEITEINYREKKRVGEVGQINDSMLMGELSVLGEKRSEWVGVGTGEEDYLMLTDYPSLQDYSRCVQLNIRLVVNLSALLCYNYYLNDFDYCSCYFSPLPGKPPSQDILYEYNIEHLLFEVTEAIAEQTTGNRAGEELNGRVAMHGRGGVYADENCAFAVGYLIIWHLLTLQQALGIISKAYQKQKYSKEQVRISQVYFTQLEGLQQRVLGASKTDYRMGVGKEGYRAYQVGNNRYHPNYALITKHIGEMSNINQCQVLPNHQLHVYIAVSYKVAQLLTAALEKWEKEPVAVPKHLPGIKILVGKEVQNKEVYVSHAKNSLSLLLKYEFIDRSHASKAFHHQDLIHWLRQAIQQHVQVEFIEKTFRKPQQFVPVPTGFKEESPFLPSGKLRPPFKPDERLTFKYPFLRPTWEALRDDQYYFIVQVRQEGASIQIVKGRNWIGYEEDKQKFFQKLVEVYLKNIDEEKIWIDDEMERSLLADYLNHSR